MWFIAEILIYGALGWAFITYLPSATLTSDNMWLSLLIIAGAFWVAKNILRPVTNIIFLPIRILTLGLVGVVISAAFLWLITHFVPGFSITNAVDFVLATIAMTFTFLFVDFVKK